MSISAYEIHNKVLKKQLVPLVRLYTRRFDTWAGLHFPISTQTTNPYAFVLISSQIWYVNLLDEKSKLYSWAGHVSSFKTRSLSWEDCICQGAVSNKSVV